MHEKFLPYLVDPATHEPLELRVGDRRNEHILSGELFSDSNVYPIIDGVPCFVQGVNYARSFGYQWNKWPRLQFDSENVGAPMQGYTTSMWESITAQTKSLHGQVVVDMGCGPGRFVEVIRKKGAMAIGLDYSSAAFVARKNFAGDHDVLICQANALAPPVRVGSVDGAYSIGVLHHLPDPEHALELLAGLLRPGGWLSVCVYERGGYYNYPNVQLWRKIFGLLAPVLGHRPALLYAYLTVYGFRAFDSFSWLRKIYKIPFPHISLPDIRWAVLDTFDSITPQYQSGHDSAEVEGWLKAAGLVEIQKTNWGSTSYFGISKDFGQVLS